MVFKKGHKINLGRKHSEKVIRKMSEAQRLSQSTKKLWENPEFRRKQIASRKGKHYSPRTEFKKGKISAFKGYKHTEESKNKNKLAHLGKVTWVNGKKHTEESKRKMSLAKIGNRCHLGKYHSEKTKQKISRAVIEKYKKDDGIREKVKKARAKQILPIKDTSIEVKIQRFLKKLKIEYFTHQYIKIEHGYQCDILIPSMNLVIECDGDYWHNYPIGREVDHIRTKELIEKGFKVLRLWEFEIRVMNINEFKEKLKNE